jgi:hypothetical protein
LKITNLNKAEVLIALYNNAKVLDLGEHALNSHRVLDHKDAEELLKKKTKFDYLYGRVLKVDLTTDELETARYNRDNGQGAAEKALQPLIAKRERFILDKCTPQTLVSLEVVNKFPELEVDPMKAFKRRVKQLLDGISFLPEAQKYAKQLYMVLESDNPYIDSIHLVAQIRNKIQTVAQIRNKIQTGFLASYPSSIRQLSDEVIRLMRLYIEEEKLYTSNVEKLKISNESEKRQLRM